MKNHIIGISLTITLALSVHFAFGQDSLSLNKGDRSEANLPAFKYASADSAADFRHFIEYAEANITNNKRDLEYLKTRKMKGDNELKAQYRNQVSELEDKNEEMAMRIAISDLMSTRNWASFKRDFTEDMKELTTSIKDLSDRH